MEAGHELALTAETKVEMGLPGTAVSKPGNLSLGRRGSAPRKRGRASGEDAQKADSTSAKLFKGPSR